MPKRKTDDPENLTSEEIARASAQLRAAHTHETTELQRTLDRATAVFGWPGFVGLLLLTIILWIGGNIGISLLGGKPWDSPPFVWLQGAVTIASLCLTALVLTTQRREERLASHRDQLILELAVLNEQKAAKIIRLLEEMRKDDPSIQDRVDDEAQSMSKPSDMHVVLEAIKNVENSDK